MIIDYHFVIATQNIILTFWWVSRFAKMCLSLLVAKVQKISLVKYWTKKCKKTFKMSKFDF